MFFCSFIFCLLKFLCVAGARVLACVCMFRILANVPYQKKKKKKKKKKRTSSFLYNEGVKKNPHCLIEAIGVRLLSAVEYTAAKWLSNGDIMHMLICVFPFAIFVNLRERERESTASRKRELASLVYESILKEG